MSLVRCAGVPVGSSGEETPRGCSGVSVVCLSGVCQALLCTGLAVCRELRAQRQTPGPASGTSRPRGHNRPAVATPGTTAAAGLGGPGDAEEGENVIVPEESPEGNTGRADLNFSSAQCGTPAGWQALRLQKHPRCVSQSRRWRRGRGSALVGNVGSRPSSCRRPGNCGREGPREASLPLRPHLSLVLWVSQTKLPPRPQAHHRDGRVSQRPDLRPGPGRSVTSPVFTPETRVL